MAEQYTSLFTKKIISSKRLSSNLANEINSQFCTRNKVRGLAFPIEFRMGTEWTYIHKNKLFFWTHIANVNYSCKWAILLMCFIKCSISDVLQEPKTEDIVAVQKAKTLYRSCINECKCSPFYLINSVPKYAKTS